jgi:cell division protein YceG involved in septum cleavage
MIVVLIALGAGAVLLLTGTAAVQRSPVRWPRPASVVVPRGADLEAIAGQLQRQNVITNELIFSAAVRVQQSGRQAESR